MYPLLPFTLNQPLAVDNAISTIGAIHKLIKKINEVIEEVNSIDSKANEYTDSQIELLNNQLRAYINELNEITITHFNNVDNAILSNTHSIEQLEDDITALHTSFDNLAISVTEQINTSINAIKSYVDLQIEIVKELIKAQNPEINGYFGRRLTIQNAFDEMKNLMNFNTQNPPIKLIKTIMDNSAYTYNSTPYNYKDLTIGDLKSSSLIMTAGTQYITFSISNTVKLQDILTPNNMINIWYKPMLGFMFLMAVAMANKHSVSGTYSFYSTIGNTLNAQGWCYGVVGNMTSTYTDMLTN